MAVLATLEQAGVLPPEGSREANHIIKSVIQFQSVFVKSPDPSVQDFVRDAVTRKYGERAAGYLAAFRSGGWTPAVLEALADADQRAPDEMLHRLSDGLRPFHVSVEDFRQLMQLVREGRRAITTRGESFQDVFATFRRTMPGTDR